MIETICAFPVAVCGVSGTLYTSMFCNVLLSVIPILNVGFAVFGRKFISGSFGFIFNLVSGCRILGENFPKGFYLFLMFRFPLDFLTMITDDAWFSCRIWAFGKTFSISMRIFAMSTCP